MARACVEIAKKFQARACVEIANHVIGAKFLARVEMKKFHRHAPRVPVWKLLTM